VAAKQQVFLLASFLALGTCLTKSIMKKLQLIILALVLSAFSSKADSFDDIMQAMKSGQTSGITKFFSNNVELTLLDNEGIYSKQQSEQMLKNFFAQHPPKM
jgi:hypothetical protein